MQRIPRIKFYFYSVYSSWNFSLLMWFWNNKQLFLMALVRFRVMYRPRYPGFSSWSGFPPVSGVYEVLPLSLHLLLLPALKLSGIAESPQLWNGSSVCGFSLVEWIGCTQQAQIHLFSVQQLLLGNAGTQSSSKMGQAAFPAQLHHWKWLSLNPTPGIWGDRVAGKARGAEKPITNICAPCRANQDHLGTFQHGCDRGGERGAALPGAARSPAGHQLHLVF